MNIYILSVFLMYLLGFAASIIFILLDVKHVNASVIIIFPTD